MAGPDVSRDGSLANDESERWSRDTEQSNSRAGSVRGVWRVRLWSWAMTVPRVVSLAALLLGAYNLLGSAVTGNPVFTPYRVIGPIAPADEAMTMIYLGDIVLMSVAAAGLWFFTR